MSNHMSFGNHSRRGMAVAVAIGVLAVILAFILISAESGVAAYSTSSKSINQRGALAAVDAVLSRREARLSQMAKYGDAEKFKNWTNFEGQGDKDKDGKLLIGKNYGEDIVGRFRVRWKIEPVLVRATDGNQYISNPSIDATTPIEAGTSTMKNKQADNSTMFMYRLAAEAVLYQDPDHRTLVAPTADDLEEKGKIIRDNPIIARAQGVRFVGAVNSPVFRWVIFYAQSGPKGDLELTHGGTLVLKGDVHSNGAIYMGGATQGMSWKTVDTAATTAVTQIGGADPDYVKVTGVDGLFMLSKATMYSAFNWLNFMSPASSSNLSWNKADQYYLGDRQPNVVPPAQGDLFPLDSSKNYVPLTQFGSPKSVDLATNNGTLINPYRIKDSSGLITPELTRTINGKILKGSNGSSANPAPNDARDAFRTPGGLTWSKASGHSDYFNQKVLTRETGGREMNLDKSLLGRPLEPQQLFYVDNPATVIDESLREEYARPVFRDDGVIGRKNSTTGSVIEAAGYYLAVAMGAGDKDVSAYSTRYPDMTGWDLNAGVAPQEKVGLIIRERYRPDFTVWGPDTGAKVVPANNPEFKPFAYGKQYRPVNTDGLIPVNVGLPEWSGTGAPMSNHGIHVNPAWTSLDNSNGTVTVKVATAMGNNSTSSTGLMTTYTDTMFHSAPYRLIHVGTAAVPANVFSKVALKIQSCGATPAQQQVGLRIMPGNLNSGMPKATALKSAVSSTATVLTLDTVDGIQTGTLLILNNAEIISVQQVAPTGGLLANQISVVRGVYGSSAAAALAGAPIGFAGDLPVACRLASDVTVTNPTTIQVDDASKLSVYDTLRLANTVVRIMAIAGNTLTIVSAAADGSSALWSSGAKAGQPLHWAERCPSLAMLYSPARGFFLQRRERPAGQVPGGSARYWNGNGTAGTATLAGSFTLQSSLAGDAINSDPAIATVSCVQTKTTGDQGVLQSGVSSSYEGTTAVTFYGPPGESSTPGITITQYGRMFSYKTAFRSVYIKWDFKCTLNSATIPSFLGFWDPDTTSGNVGDLGKTLSLFKISATTPQTTFVTTPTNTFGISSLGTAIGTGLGLYQVANAGQVTNYNPTGAPGAPSLPYNGSVVYNQTSATDSCVAWKSISEGESGLGSGKTTTVWSYSTPSGCTPITLPFTVTTPGAWQGTTLKAAPPATSLTFNADELPKQAPTWVANSTLKTIAEPAAPYVALTGNSTSGTTVNAGFCISRTPESIDTNSYVTRTGKWGFGSPAQAAKLYLPANSWGTSAPNTFSFRPDSWHGAAASSAPSLGSTAKSVYSGSANRACSDDIGVDPSNTEIWVGMARVNSSGVISTNPSDTKVRFYKYASTVPPSDLFVDANLVLDGNKLPVEADLANLVLGDPATMASNTSPLLIGPSVQSGGLGSANVSTVKFSDYTLTKCDGSKVTFDNAVGNWKTMYTNYLISQYQVFWGTRNITTDFFKWGEDNDSNRIAKEEWFYQTREFWSQSRWWNEEVQAPTQKTYASKTDGSGSALVDPALNTLLIEKDNSGNPGSGSTVNSMNLTETTNRRLWAKTTVLDLDLANLQSFMKTYSITQGGPPLRENFNGMIYLARSNRMPWVPDLNWTLKTTPVSDVPVNFPLANYGRGVMFDPISLCWLSNFNDYGSGLVSTIPDNYDNLSTANCAINSGARAWPYDPWTCGPKFYYQMVDGKVVPGTINAGTAGSPSFAANVGSFGSPSGIPTSGVWDAIKGVADPVADKLVPDAPGYNDRITPRFKPQDFHHGFRLVNGSTLNVGYDSNPKFGDCKFNICTPNQLYIKGDFNTVKTQVLMKDGVTKDFRLTPVAILADVITLLSNAWKDSNYRIDGLLANSRGTADSNGNSKTNSTTLNQRNGFPASDTTYNACFLTHNLPTTKDSLRFGEASSFVNTMLFLENWQNTNMKYMGSLVVMNSRRYSQAYLLETHKVYGRTPFGWAGWNARSDSKGSVPYNNRTCLPATYDPLLLGTFVNGTGFLDWCYNSNKAAGTASGTGEMVPFDFLAGLNGSRTIASLATDGIPPVYWQPNRQMTFNPDLKTEEGTPPFTPFGQTITGLGSWSRVIE